MTALFSSGVMRGLPILLVLLFVFGFLPRFCLRLIARLWPTDHLMRETLVGDLNTYPFWFRPFYVATQLESGLAEGLPARWRRWRVRVGGVLLPDLRGVTQVSFQLNLSDARVGTLATGASFRWKDTDFTVYGEDGAELPAEWDPVTLSLTVQTGAKDPVTRRWCHHAPFLGVGESYSTLMEITVGDPPVKRHSATVLLLPRKDSDALAQKFCLDQRPD